MRFCRRTTNERITTHVPEEYRITNYLSHDQKVFYNGKDNISPDADGHVNGIWKKGKSPKALGSKATRDGTYDANLNRIAD